MQHKKLSVLLVIAGVLAGIGGAFMFFIWAPSVGNEMRSDYPELAWLFWPALGVLWCIAILYASSLALYLRISIRIGENRSFCEENVRVGTMARKPRTLSGNAYRNVNACGLIWRNVPVVSPQRVTR